MATQSKSGKGARGLFEDFEKGTDGPIPEDHKVEFPTMTVSCMKEGVSIRSEAEAIFAPFLTHRYIALFDGGTIKISLRSPIMSFSFGVSTSARTPLNVKAYDKAGAQLFSENVSVPDKKHAWRTTFSSPQEIMSIILFTGVEVSYIDNFELD